MLTWVMYDIVADRTRDKAAKACLQAGLYRVQKSVFLGTLAENERDELGIRLEGLIDADCDSVYIFPMCRPDFSKVNLLGQAFDEKMVCDEVRALLDLTRISAVSRALRSAIWRRESIRMRSRYDGSRFPRGIADAQRLAGTLVLRAVHVLRAAPGAAGVPGAAGEGPAGSSAARGPRGDQSRLPEETARRGREADRREPDQPPAPSPRAARRGALLRRRDGRSAGLQVREGPRPDLHDPAAPIGDLRAADPGKLPGPGSPRDFSSTPAARTAWSRSRISRRTSGGSAEPCKRSSMSSIEASSHDGHRPPIASIAATDLFASETVSSSNQMRDHDVTTRSAMQARRENAPLRPFPSRSVPFSCPSTCGLTRGIL